MFDPTAISEISIFLAHFFYREVSMCFQDLALNLAHIRRDKLLKMVRK